MVVSRVLDGADRRDCLRGVYVGGERQDGMMGREDGRRCNCSGREIVSLGERRYLSDIARSLRNGIEMNLNDGGYHGRRPLSYTQLTVVCRKGITRIE